MAIKGLSIPICAAYNHDGKGGVTYSDPYVADSAREYSLEVEAGEDNNFYADNKIKEQSAGTFSSGKLTLTTADMEPQLAKKVLGLKTVKRAVNGKEIDELVYDDSANAPYLGFGVIEEHQINNVTKYKPIVLAKIRFKNPGQAAATRENEIDWQTSEIEASVLRSDQMDAKYQNPWQFCPLEMYLTEAEAREYIMAVLATVKAAEK